MRKFLLLFAVFAIVACKPIVVNPPIPEPTPTPDPVPTPTAGVPVKISVAGAKGVYLQAGSSAKMMRSAGAMGRDIVSTTGANLGIVQADGTAIVATFADESGGSVSVTPTKAMQLQAGYILMTYIYGEETATAVLEMASSNLAPVTVLPSVWENIFARDGKAWYISNGGLYRMDLVTGQASLLSDAAEVYSSSGAIVDSDDTGISRAWDSSAWCYADAGGNAYAIAMPQTTAIQAQCIRADGTKVDFGFEYDAVKLSEYLCGSRAIIDPASLNVFMAVGHEVYDGHPERPGSGQILDGTFSVQLYPVIFNPSAARVLAFSFNVYPVAWAYMPGATDGGFYGYIGFKGWMDKGIFANGDYSYHIAPTAITVTDTSSVPSTHYSPSGQFLGKGVGNWIYSDGHIYAGPITASPTINLVDFDSGTAFCRLLITDDDITSWSVCGGKLFYSCADGCSYQGTIDTTAGTLGPVEPYEGVVQAVTQ